MAKDRQPIPDHPGFWRRGKTVYFKYRDARGRQRWGTAATIAAAKKKRAAIETDVARGEYRARSTETVDGYGRRWVESYQGRTSKRIRETTRLDYKRKLERDVFPYFEGMRLADLEPQDVRDFAAQLAGRGLAPNTVRLALAPLKAMLATAFEDGKLRTNPAANVRVAIPRDELDDASGDELVRALSVEQLAAIVDQVAYDELGRPRHNAAFWRLLFAVLADLGLRIGELLELRWSDVDLGTGVVHVRRAFYDGRVERPKSKFGRRRLRLTDERMTALWELRKTTRGKDGDLVFTSTSGSRLSASNVTSRVLKPAAVAAGLGELVETPKGKRAESWVSLHTFRHTCATELFRRGWNAKQVQKWLGHHSAAFTVDTYVHLLDDDLPEPVALSQVPVEVLGEVLRAHKTTQDAVAVNGAGTGL